MPAYSHSGDWGLMTLTKKLQSLIPQNGKQIMIAQGWIILTALGLSVYRTGFP